MIILGKTVKIWHPGELYKRDLRELALHAEEQDLDRFSIPERILSCTDMKPYQAAIAYKAGFLSEYLKELHPDWNFKIIAEHLFTKYHVFLSERNLQNYLKRWRDNRTKFLQEGVLGKNKS